MSIYFENNIALFISAIVIAIVLWIIARKIEHKRFRRAVRASIIFLVFPIFYLGHPFLYYQSWMILFVCIADLNFQPLPIYFAIWSIFIALSQIRTSKNLPKESNIDVERD